MSKRAESGAWWCQRGGVFTLVHAPTADLARDKAARAMHRDGARIKVRAATARDLRVWADQLAFATDGAQVHHPEPEGTQLAFLAA